MKSKVILASALTLTLMSFTVGSSRGSSEKIFQQFAEKLIRVLKYDSPKEFNQLIPSIGDFHHAMSQNATVYGANLKAAQDDFAHEYDIKLLPSIIKSGEILISEGAAKGINWSNVELVKYDIGSRQTNSAIEIIITISSNGILHRVKIENCFLMNEQMYITQKISLQ